MIQNSVVIKGSLVDLRTIVHAEFDFQTLYPCPHLDALGEPIDDDWLDWCTTFWGTSQVSDIVMRYDEDATTLYVTFLSDAVPHGFLTYLMSHFPTLFMTHRYVSEQKDISGTRLYGV